jgi:hypothetical protein
MKTTPHSLFCRSRSNRRGFLQIDLIAALAILGIAMVPLGFAFVRERQVLKIDYCHSVADEIVDGEMEVLAAGAGRDFPDGSQIYTVHSKAAAGLPPGHFQLTKNGNHLRLAWLPDEKHGLGAIIRETTMP